MKALQMLPALTEDTNTETSRNGRRWGTAILAVALGAASSIVAGSSAAGAQSPQIAALRERLPDVALVQSEVLDDGAKRTRYKFSGDRAQAQRKSWTPNTDEQTSIDQHIAKEMRAGRNIDARSVDVISFEVPGKMIFHLVQGKKDILSEFAVSMQEKGGASQMAFMASYTEDGTVAAGTDAGFDAGKSTTSTRRGYGGRTVYFTPNYSYTGNKHWVTQNYEKWQSNSEWNWWAYNSYATFDPANADNFYVADMIDSTIRARPWNKNASGIVTGGPYDYEPRPQEVCHPVADLGVSIGSYASLSIPVANCYSGQEIYPEANQRMMGTAVYGETTAQRFLDFSYSFTTCCSGSNPVMSDYIWMGVQYCSIFNTLCGLPGGWSREDFKWTDGGW